MHRAYARQATTWLCLCAVLVVLAAGTRPLAHAEPRSATPLADAFENAAREWNVPRDLLVAIAYAETRLNDHAGEPSIDNGYGLMHLVDNDVVQTLPLAVKLVRAPADQLKQDMVQNIRGGAAVLDSYAKAAELSDEARADLGAWYVVVARYSNAADKAVAKRYADEVFNFLASGITGTSNDGESLSVAAQQVNPQRGPYEGADAITIKSADYGPAVWTPACTCNYQNANRPYDGNVIDRIVIHTTEGSYTSAINWFQYNGSQVSAHYVIRSSDGHITQMVREADIAWHAGVVGWNPRSIGIEHEAKAAEAKWFTDAMYRASAALTRNIALKYNIPMDRTHIVGHSEFKSTKSDPGPYWDWNYYMQLVRQGSSTATPRLSAAVAMKTTVEVGETLPVEFTISNPDSATYQSQAPDGGIPGNPSTGWVYDEAECFLGNGSASYPAYPKTDNRLRVTLGFVEGTPGVPQSCADGSLANSGWRWGLGAALQPNETRKIVGYVRFRTPGTYQLKASLNNENIKEYGSDGNGTDVRVGTITVVPERRAPQVSTFDGNLQPQASVYQLTAVPDSLLGRTIYPLSALEGAYVGSFNWLGSDQNWGTGGPLGQRDRFVIRQVRPFYVPADGTYTFRLTNDDGAWLWVDGTEVVKNVGLHPATSAEGSRYLTAGLHTIAVKFFENGGDAYAGYAWRGPRDGSFGQIPTPPVAEHIGTRFRPGQQIIVAADDLGGMGLRALDIWVNGSQQPSSARPIALSLGSGWHTVEYQARDNGDGNGNTSSVARVQYQVDPNFQLERVFMPAIRR